MNSILCVHLWHFDLGISDILICPELKPFFYHTKQQHITTGCEPPSLNMSTFLKMLFISKFSQIYQTNHCFLSKL